MLREDRTEQGHATVLNVANIAADSAYACFFEILAYLRPDRPGGKNLLDDITEDPADATDYPVLPAGVVDPLWITGKMITQATLSDAYADVRSSNTIAALRPQFFGLVLALGFDDFDATLKSAYPRELTQHVASPLYDLLTDDRGPLADGVRFASRHGDELIMWAIFERPGDSPSSRRVANATGRLVSIDVLRPPASPSAATRSAESRVDIVIEDMHESSLTEIRSSVRMSACAGKDNGSTRRTPMPCRGWRAAPASSAR
ncbi:MULTISPECIES: hypothetical protein [Bacteria]|uniref:hypothetical protein n=1 Tax=Bacteria TaxID=2 RepID=UPI003C7E022F